MKPLRELFNEQEMDFEFFRNIVAKSKIAGVSEIEIMGGEPFLLPWLAEGVECVIRSGLACSVNTNGHCVTSESIGRLRSLKDFKLRISVPSSLSSYGAKKSIEAIRLVINEGYKNINVLTVMTSTSSSELCEVYSQIASLNARGFLIQYQAPPPGTRPSYSVSDFIKVVKEVKRFARETSFKTQIVAKAPFIWYNTALTADKTLLKCFGACIACFTRVDIMPNGDVYPCVKYLCREEFLLGNIRNTNLRSIWLSNNADRVRTIIREHAARRKCMCEWRDYCTMCVGYALGLGSSLDDRCPIYNGLGKQDR